MDKLLIVALGCFLLCLQIEAVAQCPPQGLPILGNTCGEAPLICAGLDGYCSTMNVNNITQAFPGCTGFTLNNDEWLRFKAGSSTISLEIVPSNCVNQGGSSNVGLQAGIYAQCVSSPLALQCICKNEAFVLTSNNFIPGNFYNLVLDGCSGDICDYEIHILQGIAGACQDVLTVCADSCLTVCDSVFCGTGLSTAMCPDTNGVKQPYSFIIYRKYPTANIQNGGSITCLQPNVLLLAENPSGQVFWYNSQGQLVGNNLQFLVETPGIYTLKVADGLCFSTQEKLVKENTQKPQVSATGGTLDASHPSVQIVGKSINSGVRYLWMGTDNFVSEAPKNVVVVPGIYTLKVTMPATGCSSSAVVEVIQN